jgi:hypothetical protein
MKKKPKVMVSVEVARFCEAGAVASFALEQWTRAMLELLEEVAPAIVEKKGQFGSVLCWGSIHDREEKVWRLVLLRKREKKPLLIFPQEFSTPMQAESYAAIMRTTMLHVDALGWDDEEKAT